MASFNEILYWPPISLGYLAISCWKIKNANRDCRLLEFETSLRLATTLLKKSLA